MDFGWGEGLDHRFVKFSRFQCSGFRRLRGLGRGLPGSLALGGSLAPLGDGRSHHGRSGRGRRSRFLLFRNGRRLRGRDPGSSRCIRSPHPTSGRSGDIDLRLSCLGVGEFAFWLGDGAVEGAGGFEPLCDDGLGVGEGFFVGGAIGHAAWEFRDFDDEGVVFFAPVDDEFVAHVNRCRVCI